MKNIKASFWGTWGCKRSETLIIDDNGFGVIDDAAKRVFTQGQCHALAIALNQQRRAAASA